MTTQQIKDNAPHGATHYDYEIKNTLNYMAAIYITGASMKASG